MKKLHLLCVFLMASFCLTGISLAQSGWFWQNPLPSANSLSGVSFSDANTGTVVGFEGTILRTTDGGATWISQNSGTTTSLFGVSFTDANTGTAVGEDGTILRTTSGGTVVSIQNPGSPQMPDQFELHQNYPNPFNPTTTIAYTLIQTTDITLTIYNILGQRIRILVNGLQTAGERQVVWDGRDQFGNEVGSGIYICQLRTGKYVQSRKMLLIR